MNENIANRQSKTTSKSKEGDNTQQFILVHPNSYYVQSPLRDLLKRFH